MRISLRFGSALRFGLFACVFLTALGCSDDDARPDSGSDAATPDSGSDATTPDSAAPDSATDGSTPDANDAAADTASEDAGGVCLAEGIYGPCSTNPGCQCLLGATVYQFCTASCTEDSECGDPAELGSATPGCFPLNPGAADKICALICTEEADCPCGMTCTFSGVSGVNICAELQ